jgi:ACS family sodium-dependent inorganic phosphate cotransporter
MAIIHRKTSSKARCINTIKSLRTSFLVAILLSAVGDICCSAFVSSPTKNIAIRSSSLTQSAFIQSTNKKYGYHNSDGPSHFMSRRFDTIANTTEETLLSSTASTTEQQPSTSSNDDSTLATTTVAIEKPVSSQSGLLNDDIMPWIMLGLCWIIGFLSSLDRVAMSVAILPLSTEYGYSETVKGQVSSLLSLGYGLMILPCGLFISQLSPKLVLATGITLWSLATIATPAAAGFSSELMALWPLLTARAAVGAAEAVVLPSVQKLMSRWVPPERKSISVATIFSGFQAGTICAYVISPNILDSYGWRGIFYIYGAAGLAVLIPWFALAKDEPSSGSTTIEKQNESVIDVAGVPTPIETPTTTMASKASTTTQPSSTHSALQDAIDVLKSAPWKDFIKSKGFWAMVMAHAANNWGLYNNISWTPTFYAEQYGLNVKESALFAVLPAVCGALGGLAAGSVADKVLKNIEQDPDKDFETSRTTVRKIFQGIALYGPAVTLFILASHIPEQPWVAQALLTGTVGLQAFNAAGYGAANQEKAGEKWTGLLYSLTSLPGVMVGSFGVYVTGQVLDLTHDWSIIYALTATINVIGATAFVTLYDGKKEFD